MEVVGAFSVFTETFSYHKPKKKDPDGADLMESVISELLFSNYNQAPKCTIRHKLPLIGDIRRHLRDNERRTLLFRRTPFGPWLDLMVNTTEALLVLKTLTCQVEPEGVHEQELWFEISGHHLRFGPEDYMLITGLRFGGPMSVPSLKRDNLRTRVFRMELGRENDFKVPLKTIMQMVEGHDMVGISDEDVVRVCLIAIVEMIFFGRQVNQTVSADLWRLVENFNAFNRFPWGSYTWPHTYSQLNRAWIGSNQHDHITIGGFAHAFKVWIIEMLPNCKEWFTSRPNSYPRGIRWTRKPRKSFTTESWLKILKESRTNHPP